MEYNTKPNCYVLVDYRQNQLICYLFLSNILTFNHIFYWLFFQLINFNDGQYISKPFNDTSYTLEDC